MIGTDQPFDSPTLELFPLELAHRSNDGIEVSLLWHRDRAGTVTVVVDDTRTGERFDVIASAERALDAFNHPYAYAAFAAPEPVL